VLSFTSSNAMASCLTASMSMVSFFAMFRSSLRWAGRRSAPAGQRIAVGTEFTANAWTTPGYRTARSQSVVRARNLRLQTTTARHRGNPHRESTEPHYASPGPDYRLKSGLSEGKGARVESARKRVPLKRPFSIPFHLSIM
jgi:hypothetical protein